MITCWYESTFEKCVNLIYYLSVKRVTMSTQKRVLTKKWILALLFFGNLAHSLHHLIRHIHSGNAVFIYFAIPAYLKGLWRQQLLCNVFFFNFKKIHLTCITPCNAIPVHPPLGKISMRLFVRP